MTALRPPMAAVNIDARVGGCRIARVECIFFSRSFPSAWRAASTRQGATAFPLSHTRTSSVIFDDRFDVIGIMQIIQTSSLVRNLIMHLKGSRCVKWQGRDSSAEDTVHTHTTTTYTQYLSFCEIYLCVCMCMCVGIRVCVWIDCVSPDFRPQKGEEEQSSASKGKDYDCAFWPHIHIITVLVYFSAS